MADRPRESAARDAGWQRYDSSYHAPVLCKDVVEGLITRDDGVYVDGTLGGGGHTAALLDRLHPAGRVIGIDRDPEALAFVRSRLPDAVRSGRLALVQGDFADWEPSAADSLSAGALVDGILLDLGVSSHQLDEPDRGFSYRADAPLDMRMDSGGGRTAAEVLNRLDEQALRRMLHRYAEDRSAGRIAREIVAGRPMNTTGDLVAAVERAVGRHADYSRLSRVFQAVRIEVNDELGALERFLLEAHHMVAPAGRIAIIAYHSLEDRVVKRVFRSGRLDGRVHRDEYGRTMSPWTPLTRRPVTAGPEEIERNPRARSAKLRIAERADP